MTAMAYSCMSCYISVEDKIGGFFERLGKFVARHPWKFILLMIIINGGLTVGLITLNIEDDIVELYTPINSQALQDSAELQRIFPDVSSSRFYPHQVTDIVRQLVIIVRPYSKNILSETVLDELAVLHAHVNGVSKYAENCARVHSACAVSGDIFLSAEFRNAVTANNVSYPLFTRSDGITENLSTTMSRPVVEGQLLKSSPDLRMTYHLKTSGISEETLTHIQDSFKEKMEAFRSTVLDIAFFHPKTYDEELNANVSGDITLFSLTFTLMIFYACIATYTARHDCVGQRMNLGFAGVTAALLAIGASFGLVSACGLDFVSIVGTSPFLVIGIGVDDMFILLSGLADAPYGISTEDRIGHMMRTSGVAITITSLTDLLAFAAGATSVFVSVRNFCIYTGVAVTFCYLNQSIFFTACLTINERRIRSNRHYATCMPTQSKEEMKLSGAEKTRIFCCAGSPPKSRKDVESFLEKLPKYLLPKVVLWLPMKMFILCLFGGYLAASIWGVLHLEQGFLLKNLVSHDSYAYKYSQWDDVFPNQVPISCTFTSALSYHEQTTQSRISDLITTAQAKDGVSDDVAISWLSTYKADTALYNDSSEASFIQGLETFLAKPQNEPFINDIIFTKDKTQILYSRVYVFSIGYLTSTQEGDLMVQLRDIASESPLQVIPFAWAFIFYEQFVEILPQTLQTVGIAIACVFVVTLLFMPHPLLLLLVTVSMTMIMVGVFGFLFYWDLTLSSITMIHIIMSVGFSIDFAAHICHAYIIAKGTDRNARMKQAFVRAGGPIFNGAISTIVGIVVLSFAKSYIFQSFFSVMLLVICFGAAHSLLLLPTILSLIGPTDTRRPKPKLSTKARDKVYLANGYVPNYDATFYTNAGLQQRITNNRRPWMHSFGPYSSYAGYGNDTFHPNPDYSSHDVSNTNRSREIPLPDYNPIQDLTSDVTLNQRERWVNMALSLNKYNANSK